jgi:hypothetical protein
MSLLRFNKGYDAYYTTSTSRYAQVRTVKLTINATRRTRFPILNEISNSPNYYNRYAPCPRFACAVAETSDNICLHSVTHAQALAYDNGAHLKCVVPVTTAAKITRLPTPVPKSPTSTRPLDVQLHRILGTSEPLLQSIIGPRPTPTRARQRNPC